MFEEIKLNPSNKFYPLNIDAIKKSESKLGLDIPQLLKEFYIEVGYGFIKSKVDNVNRVMDPESVLDFRLGQNDFEFYPDIEIFDDFEEDKLVFFEANETVMISIGFGSNNYGKIYYYDMEISKNLKEFFDKLWNDVIAPVLSERYATFSKDTVFKYKGESYPLKVYAPMFFKVNTNALGKAGAYTLEDYKVEGDMVYLKFKAPSVDVYQYEVKASYHQDNQEFFQGLIDEHNKVVETNYSKGLIIRFVYQLAALDFKADNYVNLQGMDYYDTSTHYLAIKVDSKGNAKIDKENIANLLQINMKPANEANKGKFE